MRGQAHAPPLPPPGREHRGDQGGHRLRSRDRGRRARNAPAHRGGAPAHPRGHRPAEPARERGCELSTEPQVHPALKTRITDLFGVKYPVVQTGMGYVSDARLTAATAAAGGLGILSAGLLSYEELSEAIDEVKEQTDQPFG